MNTPEKVINQLSTGRQGGLCFVMGFRPATGPGSKSDNRNVAVFLGPFHLKAIK